MRVNTLANFLVGVREGFASRVVVPTGLLALAAVGWWWSARMAGDMSGMSGMPGMDMSGAMSFGGFMAAWAAMMAAMMLPAVLPAVRLYGLAAAEGRAAPLPFFASGYLFLWIATGLPAYFAWQALEQPLATAEPWTGTLAGAILVLAAVWQVTPLKSVCLRHCRSPLSFFLRHGRGLTRPAGAARMGLSHAGFCLGCCWALFAVLVAVGTMSIGWMLGLTLLIVLERNFPGGERIALAGAVTLAAVGLYLLLEPASIERLM